jgi:hypothetical protein
MEGEGAHGEAKKVSNGTAGTAPVTKMPFEPRTRAAPKRFRLWPSSSAAFAAGAQRPFGRSYLS